MQSIATVLVATDLGVAGDQAIAAGRTWASRYNARLVVVHVGPAATHDQARARLSAEVAEADIHVVDGDKAELILATAKGVSAELIVLGGRAATGLRWVFGSVAERVVANATVPVLVARADEHPDGTILAATDFSEPSLPAVAAAHELARRSGSKVTIVHCIEREGGMSELSALSKPEGVDSQLLAEARAKLHALCERTPDDDIARVVVGQPADCIVRLAASSKASLIVVASHGRKALARILVGSVAAKVAREAPCSVLVVRIR